MRGGADAPAHGGFAPFVCVKPQYGLVDAVAAAQPGGGAGNGQQGFDAQEDGCGKPDGEHDGVGAEHAGKDKEEVEAFFVHQDEGGGEGGGKEGGGGHNPQPEHALAVALQGVGEAAVAVGQFGAAQQALFRAEAAVAQGFGNRGGIGGEEVAAFFEKADEFGKLAAGVEQHGGM
ncbi:hypothetical protein HMPREF9120_02723 [Neisseria sp. oral taxon 020 str. F0370]|nr:hypothetical protein HMPREF9120_02723 [Neisseria sp. oral taxon 020 str. F0370]